MKLFEIAQEELELMNELIENDGELTPEMEQRLKLNAENKEAKAEAYCKIIRTNEANIAAAKAEKERLDNYIKRLDHSNSRLKYNLLNFMQATECKSIDAGTFRIGTRKSTSVEIFDVTALPKEFITTVVTENINKSGIKDAIKCGVSVSGAQLVEKQSIQIR